MRYVRFGTPEGVRWGSLDGELIRELGGDVFTDYRLTGREFRLQEVKLMAPAEPTKVVCLGMNYASHAREIGLPIPADPAMFLKPLSALSGPGDPIPCPTRSNRVEHEAELAFVMRKRAFRIGRHQARDAIWGYTCANDVTARDIQLIGGNYLNVVWSKAYTGFCPIGPWLVVDELEPDNVEVKCLVNGSVRQNQRTSDFIFDIAAQVAWISQIMPLEPGDVVLTGTPKGVGLLKPGDTVTIEISGIGSLTNPVVSES
jgi:2-keto-4-pentenoate hydratase/2-oxohepta-3-ene-1,7-dioic acid hydratase in catechol pathway